MQVAAVPLTIGRGSPPWARAAVSAGLVSKALWSAMTPGRYLDPGRYDASPSRSSASDSWRPSFSACQKVHPSTSAVPAAALAAESGLG
jgi:hypothetical protein